MDLSLVYFPLVGNWACLESYKMNPTFHDLIGKPFSEMGRGPDSYDCWGLVMAVGNRLGIQLQDYGTEYWDEVGVRNQYREHAPEFDKVEVPQAGDIVVYKEVDGKLHFGIMIDQYHFLQANRNIGVGKTRWDSPLTIQLIEGFYRCRTI
jgi:cell wall-associated NlpC family hydrolase